MAGLRRIMITVPSGLLDEVDTFVKKEGRNRSEVVREAVRMYLRERALSELRDRMRDGYAKMGAINLAIARECVSSDEEAFQKYERLLVEADTVGN
ncbi:MAG: ribbon-helix-helix protein, CopG family [Firmicutes bacterium]|nr:ribbon-helix-helix protein, CopG family [Bacillota bacterium]